MRARARALSPAPEDVGSVTQRSLRAAVGFVPQDVVLFNASIGHNIGYGRLGLGDAGASREEVERAARGAQLESFVAQQAPGREKKGGEVRSTLSRSLADLLPS